MAWVPDLQCAWQVLLQCAGPRCHHFLRTVPDSEKGTHGVGHDRGMMQATERLLGGFTGGSDQQARACQIASLPMRLGGLGIDVGDRMSQAAYWASCADALHMTQQRLPQLAEHFVTALSGDPLGEGCWTTRVSTARHGLSLCQIARSLVTGSTAGSSTRLPLLNTSSGRPWFSPSRAPPTRLTSGRILDRDQVTYCWAAPQDHNVGWNLRPSAPWCWRDCVCH